ncbi:MAG: hypothetical protein NC398_07695 [Acetatifactor muris]|nr:hypothetical protein [Acetatifactor muris]MCM1527293.1 hypothetical protein [Bacteroides sp.]
MKQPNGFSKRQKEEIREIVKSEIQEALRKNAKPEINVKNEAAEAIYSVLNEKNDDLIIEDKINKKETEKSLFAYNMKWILHSICYLAWGILILFFIATVYLCITEGALCENPVGILTIFIVEVLVSGILFIFHKSIKHMNKSDSYNALMFIITIIAFILTISTTL